MGAQKGRESGRRRGQMDAQFIEKSIYDGERVGKDGVYVESAESLRIC
jgi:hypothetical protein